MLRTSRSLPSLPLFLSSLAQSLFILNLKLLLRAVKVPKPRLGWNKWVKRGLTIYFTASPSTSLTPSSLSTHYAERFWQQMQQCKKSPQPTSRSPPSCPPKPSPSSTSSTSSVSHPSDPTNHGFRPLTHRLSILTTGSFLLTVGSLYRCLLTFLPRPRDQPA